MKLRLAESLDAYNTRLLPGRAPLTQKEIARKLQVSESYISYLFHNKREPRVGLARRLAELLACTVDDLYASDDSSTVKRDAT